MRYVFTSILLFKLTIAHLIDYLYFKVFINLPMYYNNASVYLYLYLYIYKNLYFMN